MSEFLLLIELHQNWISKAMRSYNAISDVTYNEKSQNDASRIFRLAFSSAVDRWLITMNIDWMKPDTVIAHVHKITKQCNWLEFYAAFANTLRYRIYCNIFPSRTFAG